MTFCRFAVSKENGGTPTDAFNCICTKGVREGSELPNLLKDLAAGKGLDAIWAMACHKYRIVGDEAQADAHCDWRHDDPGDTTIMSDGSLRS